MTPEQVREADGLLLKLSNIDRLLVVVKNPPPRKFAWREFQCTYHGENSLFHPLNEADIDPELLIVPLETMRERLRHKIRNLGVAIAEPVEPKPAKRMKKRSR